MKTDKVTIPENAPETETLNGEPVASGAFVAPDGTEFLEWIHPPGKIVSVPLPEEHDRVSEVRVNTEETK